MGGDSGDEGTRVGSGMWDLDGRVALVTGGSRGLGREMVLAFAQHGADVAIASRKLEGCEALAREVEREKGRRALGVACHVGHWEECDALVERVLDHFGRIDILVNNARAIIGKDKVPVTELEKEVWDHFLAINTTAVFLTTKAVAPHMIDSGRGGRIINIASNAGKQASANGAAYSASKFAVLGLTQATAMDLAPYNITVNAVCPGPINTDRMSYWERDQAEKQGITQEEFRGQIVENSAQNTPLGRIAEAQDVANMVAFLSGEDASFITGQSYNVNGGQLFH